METSKNKNGSNIISFPCLVASWSLKTYRPPEFDPAMHYVWLYLRIAMIAEFPFGHRDIEREEIDQLRDSFRDLKYCNMPSYTGPRSNAELYSFYQQLLKHGLSQIKELLQACGSTRCALLLLRRQAIVPVER